MTVGAVIQVATIEDALADAAGRAAIRRMVEAAWAGGATPIVVVAPDIDGQVARALAGSPAVLAEPAPEGAQGGQFVRGIRVAAEQVTETDAVLLWPGAMAWVDAETVTTLIERHGVDREPILRPRYGDSAGWPLLLPLALLPGLESLDPGLAGERLAEILGARFAMSELETGDPGTVHDRSTALDALPPYAGPPEPVKPAPEWGAAAADSFDETALEGPALAPYPQAADDTAD